MADKKWTCKRTDRVSSTQGQGGGDIYLVHAIKIMSTLLFVHNEKLELNSLAVPEQAPGADGEIGRRNGFRDSLEKLARQQQSNFHMNNYPTVRTGTSFISIWLSEAEGGKRLTKATGPASSQLLPLHTSPREATHGSTLPLQRIHAQASQLHPLFSALTCASLHQKRVMMYRFSGTHGYPSPLCQFTTLYVCSLPNPSFLPSLPISWQRIFITTGFASPFVCLEP